jgi:CheY-like chemotaxis protein
MGRKRNICNFFVLYEDILLCKNFAQLFAPVKESQFVRTGLFMESDKLLDRLTQTNINDSETYIFVDFHAKTFVAVDVIEQIHKILQDSHHTIIGVAQAMYPEMLRQGKLVGMTQLLTKPMAYELSEKMLEIANGKTVQLNEKQNSDTSFNSVI